ncbi:MAG TPA: hypothetical protein VJT49_04575 [Amycolatopsis sp.]|uniref:hypothetical protein n=1 Tax=Amycolatopsis sp. TaxID=37632 RepID=UPI002B49F250|nr:hypothetical protein [Amycolatopsis sp.]HKS44384.1 hypothetical protein [Amycolatopsis sp.]
MKSVFVAYLSLAFGLPAALVIILAVRHKIRSRRALRSLSPRVSVADIMARVAIERAAEQGGTPRLRRPATALPCGRVWPDSDQDALTYSVTVPIQRRWYVDPEYRGITPSWRQ